MTPADVDAFYFGRMSVMFRDHAGHHVVVMMERIPDHPMRVLRFRALDKPKEQEQNVHITGDLGIRERVKLARARVAAAKGKK